ncbi:hypothetical protein BLNAU_22819 [Blattamonas nauphoetae]|uniref:Uncharacterized protein n=1 Tax=Blattamonas nauphoetae TaxID=2049346 RepID=A0ABQ9WW43_9EUKA|nr:hypothetical protein BLNAU_22819 [Blattamonas nauphoetae]
MGLSMRRMDCVPLLRLPIQNDRRRVLLAVLTCLQLERVHVAEKVEFHSRNSVGVRSSLKFSSHAACRASPPSTTATPTPYRLTLLLFSPRPAQLKMDKRPLCSQWEKVRTRTSRSRSGGPPFREIAEQPRLPSTPSKRLLPSPSRPLASPRHTLLSPTRVSHLRRHHRHPPLPPRPIHSDQHALRGTFPVFSAHSPTDSTSRQAYTTSFSQLDALIVELKGGGKI